MLAIQKFMHEHTDFNEARAALYKMGIKTTYTDNLVLFSMIHVYKKTLDNILQSECNGLILSRVNWHAVVVPPKSLQFNLNTALTNEFLQKNYYSIYKVNNGTSFNVYYQPDPCNAEHNMTMYLSTANGLNMANVSLNDKKTLAEYINEACGGQWHKLCEKFDPTICYSFGFSHPDYHPMTDKPTLWFIQSVNIDPTNPNYLQVSHQPPDILANLQNDVKFESQILISHIANVEELYKISADSENIFYNTGEKNYGFILRSNVSETGLNSDLYIESRLMKKIRQYWYDSSAVQMCINRKLPKQTVIPLMNYLSGNQADFCRLFNFEDEFIKYQALTNSLVRVILNATLSSDDIRAIKFHSTATYLSLKFTQSKANKLFETATHDMKVKLLTDFLQSPAHFETYLTLLN